MNSSINSLENRLERYIDKTIGGCWLWIGASSGNNAVIRFDGKNISVKKYFYSQLNPSKKINGYLHCSCRNRLCVNPDHLMNRDDYFYSFIEKDPISGCWNWTALLKGGYGYFSINHKEYAVHRLMFEKHNGNIPKGMNVCHTCDNPKCCNLEHLWLGTQKENVRDMMDKKRGTKATGIKHWNCKVTEEQVIEVKLKYKSGVSMKQIHRELNLPYRTVQHICSGTSWKHITI